MGFDYLFFDIIPYDLYVINTLPVEVKIKADDLIDFQGSSELVISSTDTVDAKIYTNKPKFVSLVNFPIIIDWEFKDNAIYVVIR